ncbi:MAG: RodZ domain-containing protein [Pseudomonadota bacterium]
MVSNKSDPHTDPAPDGPHDEAEPALKLDSVGTILARARNAQGEELDAIADTIRIRRALLEALENDAHDQLPGGIYTIGFVRSYASYLKLDAEALEKQWRQEAEALTKKAEYSFPTPTLERRLPGVASIAIGLVILSLPLGAAIFYVNQDQAIELDIPALPERLQAYVPDYPAPEIDLPTETPAPLLATPIIANGTPEREVAPEPIVTDPTPQPGVTLDKPAQSFGTNAADARLSIVATRDVWVQVRDSNNDDRIILTRVLHANDTYHVPNRDGLLMTLGDAGAVRALLPDGTEHIPGNDGAVIRDIPLDADGIKQTGR